MSIWNIILDEIAVFKIKYDIIELFPNSEHHIASINYRDAICIITNIMERHKKRKLQDYLSELYNLERDLRGSIEDEDAAHREHVRHSLYTYILGIYINEYYLPTIKNIKSVNHLQWKIAALFHDIGYLAAIHDNVSAFITTFNQTENRGCGNRSHIHIDLQELCKLEVKYDALYLIQRRLNAWGIDIEVTNLFNDMRKHGKYSHGVVSSLATLHMIDHIYSYNGWGRSHFYSDVVTACAAIYVHDYKGSFYSGERIIPQEMAPVAILLKLADCLQEWDRSHGSDEGFDSTHLDIVVEDGKLLLYDDISDQHRKCIKQEICKSLGDGLVDVLPPPNTK